MRIQELLEKKDSNKVNPRTALQMKRSRARNPQADSDLDAFIIDYQKGQQQDRRDIGRLDYETDELEQETNASQSDIDRLDQEIEDLKRRIQP